MAGWAGVSVILLPGIVRYSNAVLLNVPGTAIGLAVLAWFLLAVIFDTVLFGVFIATGGLFNFGGGVINLPDWFFAAELVVPPDAVGYFAFTLFGVEQTFGLRVQLPGFVTPEAALLSLFLWTAVPLLLALWWFRTQYL